jgi:hypothetical protein
MKVVEAVDQAYIAMIANLEAAHAGALTQIQNAYEAEEEINALRNRLITIFWLSTSG